mmetsp:Transcript_5456/g.12073  ORF Transcript_5456/g.12073 Transcript_5456/m.12073 type:complete len:105 (-) Transcript_5456:6-320(-)
MMAADGSTGTVTAAERGRDEAGGDAAAVVAVVPVRFAAAAAKGHEDAAAVPCPRDPTVRGASRGCETLLLADPQGHCLGSPHQATLGAALVQAVGVVPISVDPC